MREEYFKFLDELRESGDINMFDAGKPLMERFNLPKDEAYNVLIEWMQTFGERHAH